MKLPRPKWIAAAAVVAATAFAHDPYEITTEIWYRPATIEFVTTMARSTAADVLAGKTEQIPFEPSKFEELRPRFETRGATLYNLSLDGAALPAPTVKVELTIENDLELHIVYPRPAPGTLHIEAPFVGKLGYGYGDVLTAHGDKGAFLGQKMLTGTDPALEVPVAAAPVAPAAPLPQSTANPTPAKTPAAAAPPAQAPAPVPTEPRNARPAVIVAAIFAAALFAWLMRNRVRRRPEENK